MRERDQLDTRRLTEVEMERDHYRAMLEELMRALRAGAPRGVLRHIVGDALD